jgi:hypothetical protein
LIPIVPMSIAWERPAANTWKTAADGNVTDKDGRPVFKFQANQMSVHGLTEIVVESDGAVYGVHHLDADAGPEAFRIGHFVADDSLELRWQPRTLRVLDDGQVVVEDPGGGNRTTLPVRVDPPAAQGRRAALLQIEWFVNLAPALRKLVAPPAYPK